MAKTLWRQWLDVGNNIQLMPDGNYLIAASTSSDDGDFSGIHGAAGFTDGALLKITPSGDILWYKMLRRKQCKMNYLT